MSDIFREVDEDLAHERYKKLWDKYGAYVIGAAVFIALSTLGVQLWAGYQKSKQAEESDRYIAAIEAASESGDPVAAATSFGELAKELSPGYGVLAKFQQAAALIEAGDSDAALGLYDAIAVQGNADPLLKDLARIRAAYLLMDTISTENLQSRLKALDIENGPWRYAAREIIAYTAFREGDLAAARSGYQRLSVDPLAPANMKARAEQMIAVIGPLDLSASAAETAPEEEAEKAAADGAQETANETEDAMGNSDVEGGEQ